MSLFSMLYKTYESNAGVIGIVQQGSILAPVAHMNANAQIELVIDQEGNFVRAVKRAKEEGQILIPVTESSAGRSSGAAPHALCDTLSYISGDFSDYCTDDKLKKTAQNKYICYIEALKKWSDSEFSTEKVGAVYLYLVQKRVIYDLVQVGIVQLDENQKFDNSKVEGQPYEKALVAFRVNIIGDKNDNAVWTDVKLQKAYTDYYLNTMSGRKDICYLFGSEKVISENHPKGIVASSYGAKLISANDGQGFTYRGRFGCSEEAMALSYEASQKVHSVLTWLIKKQGEGVGKKEKRTFLVWNPNGRKYVDVFDSLELIEDEDADLTMSNYKQKTRALITGYKKEYTSEDDMVMVTLDAATTGRLSVTYYSEFKAYDLFDRIQKWYDTCCWFFVEFTRDKKRRDTIETPTLKTIVECAYGTDKDGFLDANDKVMKEQFQNMFHCMIYSKPVSFDLVRRLLHRASEPQKYSKWYMYEKVLSVACSIIRKYYLDKGEEADMGLELNKSSDNRSYNMGRLLAVLEKVELETYRKKSDSSKSSDGRVPNAIRLQTAYMNHPWTTYMTLDEKLVPYFQSLNSYDYKEYKNLIGSIIALMPTEDLDELNRPLEASYLLGYYMQRNEFKPTSGKKEDE